MKEKLSVGEIVQSLSGRDKGEYLVVLSVDGNYVRIADGNKRKVSNPKWKKIKHLKKISFVSDELTEHIKSGKSLGNERIYRAIKSQK